MIGYVGKYAPVDIVAGFGLEAERIMPASQDIHEMPGTAHSYVRAVRAAMLEGQYSAVVVADCCDELMQMAESWARDDGMRIYALTLPDIRDEANAVMQYADEIRKLMKTLERDMGVEFDLARFVQAIEAREAPPGHGRVALVGACAPEWLVQVFGLDSLMPLVDYTCSANMLLPNDVKSCPDDALFAEWYARRLLYPFPDDVDGLKKQLERRGVAGILYHTMAGCDDCKAPAMLHAGLPALPVHTDFTRAAQPDFCRALQQFLDENGWLAEEQEMDLETIAIQAQDPDGTHYIGIDSGSSTTNVVILDNRKMVVASASISTGTKCQQSAKMAVEALLKQKKIDHKSVRYTVSTGYGRSVLQNVDKDVTEIVCHAKGAHFLFPSARTVMDVGGQDSEIITVDERGNVVDFLMNDKCAAGTGRFLEMMAEKLGIQLSEFSTRSAEWKKEVVITSMCAVFAESEVVELLAEGADITDLVHGINCAIANRLLGMLMRENCTGAYVMTGGVANNLGVVNELSARLGEAVLVPKEPHLVGALGAALLAVDESKK